MAPLITVAKATLSYPLCAVDFDPVDSALLVVGGGGGAGRTGVGNKITLLDTLDPKELREVRDIELRKDEDNVTSLAVGVDPNGTSLVFAGVNSCPEDIKKGKNLHFRVFKTEMEIKAGAPNDAEDAITITEVSKSALFVGKEEDIYQRITRLSKPFPGRTQVGAIATGLSKKSEIVLFDTTSTSPPSTRGAVQSNKEAVDVDIIQTGDDEYLFAYCDEFDIYLKKISRRTDPEEPECIYVTPASREKGQRPTVPRFRAMRFLTKELLCMLTLVANNSGVVLQIFRIPPSGKGSCRLAQSIRLPISKTKATALAVSNLTPPTSPTAQQGYTQFVIAVAGQDISISLFKVDLQVEGAVSMVSKIKPFRTFNKVHPMQITGLAFSNFIPPTDPVTAQTFPPHLKLASISMANTVIVHTLPLFPVPLSVKRGQSKTARYVVALPSTAAVYGVSAIVSIIAIALVSIVIQGVLEIRGGVPVYLNARSHLPIVLQERLGRPYEFPAGYNSVAKTAESILPTETPAPVADSNPMEPPANAEPHPTGYNHHLGVPTGDAEDSGSALRLPSFFEELKQKVGEGSDIVLLKEHESEEGLKAHVHGADEEHGGKKWEDLAHEQKEGWKAKLRAAGHWADDMGETVLKGVLFSELGGIVADAIRGG
ncbi:hypothetical protein LZ554_007144 [Drepanopeziza brunnea f. sp. 'monogermtubi']|nr:hypothetical protein LZ554_007144 [Drepanopeziza brunnea f. sp. 'monogermtubi']